MEPRLNMRVSMSFLTDLDPDVAQETLHLSVREPCEALVSGLRSIFAEERFV